MRNQNLSGWCVRVMLIAGVCLTLAGCSKSTQDKLIGTWKPEEGLAVMQLTFNKDGTCTFAGANGKYHVDGDQLVVSTPDAIGGNSANVTATVVSIDEQKLTLKMPEGQQNFVRVQ